MTLQIFLPVYQAKRLHIKQTVIFIRYDLLATILSIFSQRIIFFFTIQEADGNICFYSGNRALRNVIVFAHI